MIDSVQDGKITSLERGELLDVICLFGQDVECIVEHPLRASRPRLTSDDQRKIEGVILSGIETAERFHRLSEDEQVRILNDCIFEGHGECVDFSQGSVERSDLPSPLGRYVDEILDVNTRHASGANYYPTPDVAIYTVSLNNEIYAYVMDALFDTKNGGVMGVGTVFPPDASYYREFYAQLAFEDD